MNRRWSPARAFADRRRALLVTSAALVMIVAAVTGITLFHRPSPPQPIAYTNISRNYKTCLLTTTDTDPAAVTAWTAIQAAARHKPVNAQHVTAPHESAGQLLPYLNGLLALHCQLIVTTGTDLDSPLRTVAKIHPKQHFAHIGTTAFGLPNVRDVTDMSAVAVTRLISVECGC